MHNSDLDTKMGFIDVRQTTQTLPFFNPGRILVLDISYNNINLFIFNTINAWYKCA